MTLVTRLATVAQEAAADPREDDLRVRLLSNLTVAVGRSTEAARIRAGLAGEQGPGATAMVLAAAMHARTQDDFYPAGRVHVGTVVIPAILAIGEGDLLGAMAAGYEVLTLASGAYSARAQQRGYRPTGVFGPLGAAAAAATALGCDAETTAAALAIASTMAGGTNQSWIDGTDEWLVEVAEAARAGVVAARLAAAGLSGAPGALDGAAGWAKAYFDDAGAPALQQALEGAGTRTADVAVKLYPVSGIAQAPSTLAAEMGIELEGALPQRIEVRMNPVELDYPGSRNRGPFSGRSDSLMSVVRCVALAYLHGHVPYERTHRRAGGRRTGGRRDHRARPRPRSRRDTGGDVRQRR